MEDSSVGIIPRARSEVQALRSVERKKLGQYLPTPEGEGGRIDLFLGPGLPFCQAAGEASTHDDQFVPWGQFDHRSLFRDRHDDVVLCGQSRDRGSVAGVEPAHNTSGNDFLDLIHGQWSSTNGCIDSKHAVGDCQPYVDLVNDSSHYYLSWILLVRLTNYVK